MTTPAVAPVDEVPPQPISEDPGARNNSLAAWLLRIGSALVIPAVLILFFFTFDFLKQEDTNKLLQVAVAVAVGVGGIWLLYWGMDRAISVMPEQIGNAVRPFAFAGPAMVLLGFYLVYPAVNTFILSFQSADGDEFVGLANFQRIFTEETYLISIRNSVIWVILVPIVAVVIGLGFATLSDRLGKRSETVAKSMIFLPMAISFVGASVVWRFVYNFRPEGFGEQIGLLNAVKVATGTDPVDWISIPLWNNLFLMVILIWLQVGFAMVILSSAIKAVPVDEIEASRIDGANEWQVFRKIVVPSIASTLVVVWTTVLITTWKVFDIVFVMTGGGFDTSVVAERMVTEFFTFGNDGMGSALAVLLFVAVLPILVINVKRFQEQERLR
ncbi:MAG TPA: sugar ABC transporter permease [Acidimicrobiia bacterium]|nr:sugar ABC transporter permease [Acidimicrobiia bacterium]